MQFSTVLLAAAAGLVSAQKFTLVAIRSGSDIQNDAIQSDGKKLVLNSGNPTTYEVIGRSLYANGKPVQFGTDATIVDSDGQASKDIIVNGDDHLYVPNFDFTACPQGSGYEIVNNQNCANGGLGFAARAIFEGGSSSAAAPASSAAASASHAASSAVASASHAASAVASKASSAASAVASKASSAAAAPAPAKSEAPAAGATAGAVVSQINDGQIQAPHGTAPAAAPAAQAPKASAGPEQANGAATLGVSAVAGVVAVAMLF